MALENVGNLLTTRRPPIPPHHSNHPAAVAAVLPPSHPKEIRALAATAVMEAGAQCTRIRSTSNPFISVKH